MRKARYPYAHDHRITAEDIARRSLGRTPIPGGRLERADDGPELPLLRARWAREDREERRRGGIRAVLWEVLALAVLVGACWYLLTR